MPFGNENDATQRKESKHRILDCTNTLQSRLTCCVCMCIQAVGNYQRPQRAAGLEERASLLQGTCRRGKHVM